MFVDQMATKRIDLSTGDWIEIQYLSKGFRDEEKAYLSNIRVEFKNNKLNDVDFLKRFKETEYKRVVEGIRSWSSDRDLTVENLKLLKDSVFEEILEAIEEYNDLSEDEVKN